MEYIFITFIFFIKIISKFGGGWSCSSQILVFKICGAGQSFNVFSLHRNPDLNDRFFDGLLISMADLQAEDER